MSIPKSSHESNNNNNKKSTVKPVSEHRRVTKPIMEKRRRARINNCLDQMKCLILEAMNKDPTRHTKLEKADILEMTVSYLKDLHSKPQQNIMDKYREGFSECATEVTKFVQKTQGMDIQVKQRLMSYLNNCVQSLETDTFKQSAPYLKPSILTSINCKTPGPINLTSDVNNNCPPLDTELATPPSSASSNCNFVFPIKSENSPAAKELNFSHFKFNRVNNDIWRPWWSC